MAALKRAARLGDAWMHAGGDAATLDRYLARLTEVRSEYGRERKPFEVHEIAMEAYTLGGVKRLEDRGITECIVGFRNAYEKDTTPLQQKIDALGATPIGSSRSSGRGRHACAPPIE